MRIILHILFAYITLILFNLQFVLSVKLNLKKNEFIYLLERFKMIWPQNKR